MKLKKKLFSVLGASAVTLAAITTVVACAKKDSGGGQEEQEQEGLDIGVSFTGTTKKFVIGKNDVDLTINGFAITQPVLGGQEMRVTTTNPEVRVDAPIRPADTFSVKVTLLNTPAALDKDYNFDLIFSFAEHGAKITSKRISGFKVKYYVSWERPNYLEWKEGYTKTFVLNESQRQVKTTNLALKRKLQSQETIEITKVVNDRDTSPVTFDFIQHDIVDDTTLPLTIIANATEEQIDEGNPEHFTIHYKIVYAGTEEVKDGTISGFSIQLRKQWVSPSITAIGFDAEGATNFITEQGATGYHLNSFVERQSGTLPRYFILDRPLGEDDEIKVFCDNGNVSVTSTISQDDDGGKPYIDLDFKFNYTFDPYVAQNQVFSIAFIYYFRGEQKGYQSIPYSFKLTYTPYVDPDPIEYNYAITFNPVEMDTKGTGWLEVTGKIVRQNEDGTVTPGLAEGDYMTIGNNSQENPKDWDEKTNLSNQFEFSEYSYFNQNEEQYVFTEENSIPYTAEFGENGEFTFLVDYVPVFDSKYLDEPLDIDQIIEHPSQIVTRFYKGDPCESEPVIPAELIDTSVSMITFKYYPAGFWQQNSAEATDQWIKDRSFELALSYNEVPNDESTRKVISANTWIINSYATELTTIDRLVGHWLYLATSSEAVRTFRELFDNEAFLREHNAIFGAADPNSARKYLINDSNEYLTQNDFIYLPLNIWDAPAEIGVSLDQLISFEDSSKLTWNSEDDMETNPIGSDIGIISLAPLMVWGSYEPLMTEEQFENNYMLIVKYLISKYSLLEQWKEETGMFTNVYEDAAIKSWNNWACAVCSGFVPTTITLKGQEQPAFKWVRHDIQFGSDNLPEYKTLEESKAQDFGDLDGIDGGIVKHVAPAYKLADEYNKTSIDGGWFPGDLGGSMFAVREWDEYGVSLKTPQVVGINWNGGQQGLSGENMFTPWIDLLSDDINGDGTARSVLEEYLHPIV